MMVLIDHLTPAVVDALEEAEVGVVLRKSALFDRVPR
jgi:hypothetical protein